MNWVRKEFPEVPKQIAKEKEEGMQSFSEFNLIYFFNGIFMSMLII